MRQLAGDLGLKPVRILRDGFGFYGPDARGKRRIHARPGALPDDGEGARRRDSRFQARRRSVGQCNRAAARGRVGSGLDGRSKGTSVTSVRRSARFADSSSRIPRTCRCFRSSSSSPTAERPDKVTSSGLRKATIGSPPSWRGGCAARCCCAPSSAACRQRERGVTVTVEDGSGRRSEIEAAFLVCALPASHGARARLRAAPAGTAARRDLEPAVWLRRRDCCCSSIGASGSRKAGPSRLERDLPIGSIWDGNEQQRGAAILSFLAGGRASSELQQILREEGPPA